MGDVRIGAKSTLSTLNKWIEVISSNITGANVYGYKGVRIGFGDTLVDVLRGGTATSSIGGLNPLQTGTGGITVNATSTDWSQGSIIQTKSNTDVAIQGNSYFTINDASGAFLYTRNGSFHVDDQGFLLTDDGNFVMSVENARPKANNNVDDVVLIKLYNDTNVANGQNAPITGFMGMNFDNTNTSSSVDANIIQLTSATGANLFTETGQPMSQDAAFAAANGIPAGRFGYVAVPSSILMKGGSGGTGGIVPNQIIDIAATDNIWGQRRSNSLFDYTEAVADRQQNTFKKLNTRGAAANIGDPLNTQSNTGGGFMNNDMNIYVKTDAALPMRRAYFSGFEYRVLTVDAAAGGNARNVITAGFVPDRGDTVHFDGTGQLVNDTRGLTTISNINYAAAAITVANGAINSTAVNRTAQDNSPPYNYRTHLAIAKFTNRDGLEKKRGSSLFAHTDAAGKINIGFAGMAKFDVTNILQTEFKGLTIGLENVIQPQALEASNTSITELLPELTVAQKTFTSNTKVISVGNSIIDDMNGLIR